ncbi:hypothetical protein Btru_002989 [Bulinus truncatus]|nr:hypothetical protein Btru_002989 [Bulinus truncatus]
MEQDLNLTSLKINNDPATLEFLNTSIKPCSKENTDTESAEGMQKMCDIDGGYGWVIVTASFFNAFIIDGIGSSFGLLLPHMKEKFHASDFVMSFASSLFMAFLIMGCACGLVFLPSVIIVNAYFHNLRGVANGIICAGSGAGLVVLSLLIKYLLDNYTLDSTILILSGILLSMCVFSCLYRPPPSFVKHSRNNSHSSSSNLTIPVTVDYSANLVELNGKPFFEDTSIQEELVTENNKQVQPSRIGDQHETELKHYFQNNLKHDVVARNGCHRHIALDISEHRSPWKSENQLRSSADRPDYSFYSSVYNLPTWYHASDQAITLRKKRSSKKDKRPGSTQHYLTPHEIPLDQGSQLYLLRKYCHPQKPPGRSTMAKSSLILPNS